MLSNIKGATLRTATTIAVNGLKEGTEEVMQECLDSIFRNAILNENNEINLLSEDMLYTFIVSSLTGIAMGAGEAISEYKNASAENLKTGTSLDSLLNNEHGAIKIGNAIKNAKNEAKVINAGIETTENNAINNDAKRLYDKLQAGQKISSLEIGKLASDISEYAKQNNYKMTDDSNISIEDMLAFKKETGATLKELVSTETFRNAILNENNQQALNEAYGEENAKEIIRAAIAKQSDARKESIRRNDELLIIKEKNEEIIKKAKENTLNTGRDIDAEVLRATEFAVKRGLDIKFIYEIEADAKGSEIDGKTLAINLAKETAMRSLAITETLEGIKNHSSRPISKLGQKLKRIAQKTGNGDIITQASVEAYKKNINATKAEVELNIVQKLLEDLIQNNTEDLINEAAKDEKFAAFLLLTTRKAKSWMEYRFGEADTGLNAVVEKNAALFDGNEFNGIGLDKIDESIENKKNNVIIEVSNEAPEDYFKILQEYEIAALKADIKLRKTRNHKNIGTSNHKTGIEFERRVVLLNNEYYDVAVPKFESAFDAQLEKNMYLLNDRKQFKECNRQLKNTIENNPELRSKFTEKQIQNIMNGTTPTGYTWHHDIQAGRMMLVNKNMHSAVGHHGERYFWGGGKKYR